ncbi:C-signal-like [Tiliqua scincoides]|uniref:C-signal-like n=1 Tax=Tiliqua scincoides TaxID=71010 RepID=UPI0034631A31
MARHHVHYPGQYGKSIVGELRNVAAKHQGVVIVQLDVSDPPSIKAAAARVTQQLKGAGLNLLINNAGIAKHSTLESETPENMSEGYNINVIGPLMVSQAFLPLLRKAAQESPKKGMSCSKAAIVNISSQAGSLETTLGWDFAGHIIAYRCSKAALNMLTRCMSLGFAKDEILCISLHPGWVQTDMGNMSAQAPTTRNESVQNILSTLGRLSEKENGAFVDFEGEILPW